MKEKLRRFMASRYGSDALNQFLSVASIACLTAALISRWAAFYYIGVVLMVYSLFRMFSRNIAARTAENYKFYTLRDRIAGWWRGVRARWDSRRFYRYYACPHCRQKLRVPRGRGRIQISCPKCGTQFIRKS